MTVVSCRVLCALSHRVASLVKSWYDTMHNELPSCCNVPDSSNWQRFSHSASLSKRWMEYESEKLESQPSQEHRESDTTLRVSVGMFSETTNHFTLATRDGARQIAGMSLSIHVLYLRTTSMLRYVHSKLSLCCILRYAPLGYHCQKQDRSARTLGMSSRDDA